MKNRTIKILSAALAAVLLGSTATYAIGTKAPDEAATVVTLAANANTAEKAAKEATKAAKDETVYVLADADGEVNRIIVSDWLKNPDGAAVLEDKSNLTGIENVKGDESFSASGDSLTWQADGADLYYRGDGSEALPVTIRVRYTLDGKEISPEELTGKSGRVTIAYEYENTLTKSARIDGKTETVHVPFAVLTAALLDSETFTNIEVENGRLINDGDRSVVVGLAFPGLGGDLRLDTVDLGDVEMPELPESMTITADVTDYAAGMTLSVVTNSLFTGMDADRLDALDMSETADSLTDAMAQLLDGSSRLADGLGELSDKSGELVSGIDLLAVGSGALADGTAELSEGASTLSDGATALYEGLDSMQSGAADLNDGAETLQEGAATLSAGMGQLADGVSALSDGLVTLNENSASLTDGAKQVFETLLTAAGSQIDAAGLEVPALTIDNYGKVLDAAAASLSEDAVYKQALSAVTAAVNEQRDYIAAEVAKAVEAEVAPQVTAAVRAEVEAKVTEAARETVTDQVIHAAAGMDRSSYDAAVAAGLIDGTAQAQITGAVDAQMQTEEVRATIAAQTDAQMATDEVKTLISANTAAQMESAEVKAIVAQNTETQVQKAIQDNMAGSEVQEQLAAAAAGRESLITLKASLDQYNTFYQGVLTYTAGVASAADGVSELNDGISGLKDGADQLAAGSESLKNGLGTLTGGVADLKDGAGQLADGASTLASGTKTLADGAAELNDGIGTLQSNAPALLDGIGELRDGAGDLADGLAQFDEDGIRKLTDLMNNTLGERFRALIDAAQSYRTYSGLADGMDGTVKFIYRFD